MRFFEELAVILEGLAELSEVEGKGLSGGLEGGPTYLSEWT